MSDEIFEQGPERSNGQVMLVPKEIMIQLEGPSSEKLFSVIKAIRMPT